MAGEIVIAGEDRDRMLEDLLERLGLPREAVEFEVQTENEEDLLPGARPQIQMHVRIRPQYLADVAASRTADILNILGIEHEIQTELRGDMAFVRVSAPAAGAILIGRDGATLDALQYIINRMALRSSRDAPMIIVDIEDYRRRQFEKLEDLAERALTHARNTGNEIELDPMPALERKYLHYYLRDRDGVRTFSRGEEPDRFLVLLVD